MEGYSQPQYFFAAGCVFADFAIAVIFYPVMIEGGPKNLTKMHHRFCVNYLATNMPEGWDIIHLKVRSIAPSEVQKLLCTISGSLDISKTKWGIRFEK